MPLYAAICRSLERKSLIFLGLGFFFEPEGRGFESLPARQLSAIENPPARFLPVLLHERDEFRIVPNIIECGIE